MLEEEEKNFLFVQILFELIRCFLMSSFFNFFGEIRNQEKLKEKKKKCLISVDFECSEIKLNIPHRHKFTKTPKQKKN